ncbi:MAG: ethanolamine ammonia-lyase reactivating factor EutA [Bacteroidales bacterium]|nr:ethanolamine ammonia-lyase reactivating factor EutA [Bacteroidales bacterium]
MNVLKFAAIDIGSNAIRLLFMNVIEGVGAPLFRKSSLVRVPVRLGDDAFTRGEISPAKVEKIKKTMLAFKNLMDVQEVVAYRACATSAMREASNGDEIIRQVNEYAGVEIEIIDGKQEAEIIYSNQIVEMINDDNHYLYVDVGGGSTEITLFSDGALVDSRSFNVGTIRLLNQTAGEAEFKEIKKWLKHLKANSRDVVLIGSGGNINKIIKLSGKKDKQQLLLNELVEMNKQLAQYSLDERVSILGLNTDRADVIVPASNIFIKVMKWSGAKRILIPTIGVSDGIVHQLYQKYQKV